MRQLLILLAIFSLQVSATEWGMGMALQGRVQADINPDYYQTKALGQLFARARQVPWSVLLELGDERQHTSAGSYSIGSQSTSLGLWGRYEPWPEYAWSAFVSGGTGVFLDRMETQLGAERSVDHGHRFYLGLGAGISRQVWRQCLVELEARVQSIEQGRDPALSGLLRVGYIY
jgi:hypothetical protein